MVKLLYKNKNGECRYLCYDFTKLLEDEDSDIKLIVPTICSPGLTSNMFDNYTDVETELKEEDYNYIIEVHTRLSVYTRFATQTSRNKCKELVQVASVRFDEIFSTEEYNQWIESVKVEECEKIKEIYGLDDKTAKEIIYDSHHLYFDHTMISDIHNSYTEVGEGFVKKIPEIKEPVSYFINYEELGKYVSEKYRHYVKTNDGQIIELSY